MENKDTKTEQDIKKQRKPGKYGSGYRFEISIDSLSFGGPGVGRTEDGRVAFVSGSVPGDRVLAMVKKKKKSHLEAYAVEILKPSPDRIEPRCLHFGMCGGCKWQFYPYALQLKSKRSQVVDHLERISGIKSPPVAEIIGMDHPWEYRNKMEYTFSAFKEGGLKLGLHRPGFFDRIVNIDQCLLQEDRCNRLRNSVREFCIERKLSHHNIRSHEGLLRNLVIRSTESGLMACIVTHTDEFGAHVEDFKSLIAGEHPEVTSLYWFVNTLMSGVAIAGEGRLLAGDSFITENVSGLNMKISPASFAQTNTKQCEVLYGALRKYVGDDSAGTVYDLYSGMAPIAMMISKIAKKVIGIESISMAVSDGRENIKSNGIDNVEMIEGEVEKVIPALCESTPPDIVVTDPPRAGMHRKAVDAIVKAKPRRIVYVSCNPSTLARDAAIFIEGGYSLAEVTPVDMFPHTGHIECVARFDA